MKAKIFCFCTLSLFVFFAKTSAAQGPEFSVRGGIVFNAEQLSRSGYFNPGLKFTANALWNINPYMKLGPEVSIFSISLVDYIPMGLNVRSYFFQKKSSLFLNNTIGYALSNNLNEPGMDWGGIFIKTGLGVTVSLSPKTSLVFGLDYYLQERKYRTIIYSIIDSEMLHMVEINAGVSFKL